MLKIGRNKNFKISQEIYEKTLRAKAATSGPFFYEHFAKHVLNSKKESKKENIRIFMNRILKEKSGRKFLRQFHFLVEKTTKKRKAFASPKISKASSKTKKKWLISLPSFQGFRTFWKKKGEEDVISGLLSEWHFSFFLKEQLE
jgi:hypothetical protein